MMGDGPLGTQRVADALARVRCGGVSRFDPAAVALRRIGEDDLELLRAWRNGERVRSRMFTRAPIAPAEHRAWWARRSSDASYAQYLLGYAGRPLGTISFALDALAPVGADCGYYVGPDDAPPRGRDAADACGLTAAFGELALNEVRCEILDDNEPSLRLVHRFGFAERARRRAAARRFGLSADAFALAEPHIRALLFEETPHAVR